MNPPNFTNCSSLTTRISKAWSAFRKSSRNPSSPPPAWLVAGWIVTMWLWRWLFAALVALFVVMLLLLCSGCAGQKPVEYWSPDDPLILTPEPGFEPWVDAAAEAWRERGFMVIVGPGGVPVERVPVSRGADGTPLCGGTVITLDRNRQRVMRVDRIEISTEAENCNSLRYALLHEIGHALSACDLDAHAEPPSIFAPQYDPTIRVVVDDAAVTTVNAARESCH